MRAHDPEGVERSNRPRRGVRVAPQVRAKAIGLLQTALGARRDVVRNERIISEPLRNALRAKSESGL